jgi:hypothetical protein
VPSKAKPGGKMRKTSGFARDYHISEIAGRDEASRFSERSFLHASVGNLHRARMTLFPIGWIYGIAGMENNWQLLTTGRQSVRWTAQRLSDSEDSDMVVATCFAKRGGSVGIHLRFEAGKFEEIRLVDVLTLM